MKSKQKGVPKALATYCHIGALGVLAAVGCLAANGQQVFLSSGDEQGSGVLRARGQECYVITAAHVVRTPGTINVIDTKQANHQAEVVRRFAGDIAVLKTEAVPQTCSSADSQVSSQTIESALKKGITGKLVRILENGASAQIRVSVKQYDVQFITVSPLNSSDTLAKGWSGSLLYVDDTRVGMLVTEDESGGQAYRVDYVEQVIGAFFRDENVPVNLAQTPEGICRIINQWQTGMVSTDVKYYIDGQYVGTISVRKGDASLKYIDFKCSPGNHKYAAEFTRIDDSQEGAAGRTLQCNGPLNVSTARAFKIGVVAQALFSMSCRVYEYPSR